VLEHSAADPIVKPAFRLRAVGGPEQSQPGPSYPEVSAMPVLTVVGADQLPRPALAFLGEDPPPVGPDPAPDADRRVGAVDRPAVIRFDDLDRSDPPGDGSPVLRTPHQLPPEIPGPGPGLGGDVRVRRGARQRRRATLGVLASVFLLTLMIGFVPGAGPAWIVSIVFGLALAAYVVMLAQLRRAAEERERKLSYLHPGPAPVDHSVGTTGVPVYMSGRYAHPSNQAAVAR
jgi:hypothetical protein